jgi:hypothetical protein
LKALCKIKEEKKFKTRLKELKRYSMMIQRKHVNNKFQIIRRVNNKELRTLYMSYENSYKKFINLSYSK